MLFDPKWQKPAPTCEPTLEGFKVWVGRQQAADRYYWPNPNDCAAGRYYASCGVEVGLHEVWRKHSSLFLELSCLSCPAGHEWGTFGELAEKL